MDGLANSDLLDMLASDLLPKSSSANEEKKAEAADSDNDKGWRSWDWNT